MPLSHQLYSCEGAGPCARLRQCPAWNASDNALGRAQEVSAAAAADSTEHQDDQPRLLGEQPDQEPEFQSKGKKLKEGFSNLFSKALKKEQ